MTIESVYDTIRANGEAEGASEELIADRQRIGEILYAHRVDLSMLLPRLLSFISSASHWQDFCGRGGDFADFDEGSLDPERN
jgi:hypothetical protein